LRSVYALSLSGILHSFGLRPALGANVLAKPKKRTPPPPPAIEAPPAVEAGHDRADVDELFSRLNVEKATTTFSAYLKGASDAEDQRRLSHAGAPLSS